MNEQTMIQIINLAISFIVQLISMGQQLYGKVAIPDFDVILAKYNALQAKIDAEKAEV